MMPKPVQDANWRRREMARLNAVVQKKKAEEAAAREQAALEAVRQAAARQAAMPPLPRWQRVAQRLAWPGWPWAALASLVLMLRWRA